MNTYEKIKKYLKHGILPIVQNANGYYAICKGIDKNGCIHVSKRQKTKEELLLGGGYFYSQEEIEEQKWQIVGIYDIPRVPFEVGQKVKIIDKDIDNDDYRFAKKHFNDICYIQEVKDTCSGLYYRVHETPDKIGGLTSLIRHDWLLPVLETRTVDDVLAGLSAEDKAIIMERLK